MAKNEAGLTAIKEAFDCGFNAFCRVEPNERGFMNVPPNPYRKDSLTYKEWIRGYNRAHWENSKKVQTCA